MKFKIFIVVVAVVVAWFAGRGLKGGGLNFTGAVHQEQEAQQQGQSQNNSSERRINESIELVEGAHVEVVSINGSVSVEATDGNEAEVRVTSTAGSIGDLDEHRITVEHTNSNLVIRGKGNNGWGFWRWLRGGGEVRHSIVLKLPRRAELATRGINGKVIIGGMEGAVQVSGINGRVEIGRATGGVEVNGVNGGVTLTITELAKEGVRVNGINGGVELRFGSGLNADLNLNGVNGNIAVEAPNVEVLEQKRSKLRARIGTGGAGIKANGINGGVRLVGV